MTAFHFVGLMMTVFSLTAFGANEGCVSAYEYVPLVPPTWGKGAKADYQNLGYYQRISPEGRFVVRSLSGAGLGMVSLLELRSGVDGKLQAVPYPTPLSNEAFALLSTFRYVVDIGGQHYRIKDILEQGAAAKSHFRAGATGVYAASTELAGGNDQRFRIRSIAWPNANSNDDSRGAGTLYMMESQIERDEKGRLIKTKEDRYELCANLAKTEGQAFTTPMISISGDEFAARPLSPADKNPSMRIYKILQNGSCEKVADLGMESEKAYFGVNSPGKPAPLLWVGRGLHLWDRELDKKFYLGNSKKPFDMKGFPSMTKDGRVVVGASWSECDDKGKCLEQNGFVRIDPNQSEDVLKYTSSKGARSSWMKSCITLGEVQRLEAEQDKIYGFTGPHSGPVKIQKGQDRN